MLATQEATLLRRFDDVDVFGTELEVATPDPDDLALLSADERARAMGFHHERDRAAFTARRALLRRLLSRRVDRPPSAIVIEREPGGRPFVAGGPAFSVSRTEGYVVIAIGTEARALGVDVERIHAGVAPGDLATRFFAASEAAVVEAAGATGATDTFFRLWTLKEAYQKAQGVGLLADLRDCPFVLADPPRLADPRLAAWRFETFEPAPGLVAALARPPVG
jgi:4'-phosphopantetheinyl transferase